ncbi:probable G-protein coupled receptor 139 [Narcine bancroftii]|uniref:probable G-protein coupled receptor 139 n=1 Tax=Narcine bancroftii TaxID=1343680 RepID=UPI0038310E0C
MWESYLNVEKVLYLIIAVTGVPVNFVAIVILSRGKCGLSTCTSRYLVAMVTADLMVIITEVILSRIKFHYFPMCFLHITPVCSVLLVLTRAATDCSVWFTVSFTVDRFVAICCLKLKAKYCTGRTAALVLATTGVLLFTKNVPFYFFYEPLELIDNVAWFCQVKLSIYTDPGWNGFHWFDKCLNPFLPFIIILLFNGLTIRFVFVASRVRKGLIGLSKAENRSDPRMEGRRRSMVLLFTISGSFLSLWMTNVLQFAYYRVAGIGGNENESQRVFNFVGYLLRTLSCCTNTFIYATTQSKFREELKSALKYIVCAVVRFIQKSFA